MNILAFDTSTNTCSVALLKDGEIVAEHFELMARGQSEALVPMIGSVLDQAGLTTSDMDLMAVTTGPGAFTGVRIGLATARALALASHVPLIGVSTFDALVNGVEADLNDCKTVCVIDTKRDDVFIQHYDQNRLPVGDAYVASLEQVRDKISKNTQTALIGSGAPMIVGADCEGVDDETLKGVRVFDAPPQATNVAKIAARRGIPSVNAVPPAPVYLRKPEAKINPTGGRLRP